MLRPANVVVADAVQRAAEKRLGLRFAIQEPQLGTRHALLQAEPFLMHARGTLVLLSGDVPLLRPETLRRLVRHHQERAAAATDEREIMGVNSRRELADVNAILKSNRAEELMASGVTIIDPASTWIGPDVVVGADTVLHPNVFLEGKTVIGSGCEIHSCVRLIDTIVEDRAVINNFCVITASRIGPGAQIGPFAHLRPQSHVDEEAKVGNFVELKKTRLGKGSKASHLSYLGDSTIGQKVNIGAGTITCNYDGSQKHPTVIEDGAFIGSDTQLIAPVRVGRNAYVAAGSSITDDVPEGALGIARSRQTNKPGWVEKKKRK